MANPGRTPLHLYLIAAALALAAGFFIFEDKGRNRGGNLRDSGDRGTEAVTAGSEGQNPPNNAHVSVFENGGASGQNSKKDSYSQEEQIFLKNAVASFTSTLVEREKKRTSVLWDQKWGSGYTNVIGVRAPSVDEIGEISIEMSAKLSQAPVRLRNELRAELQKQYNAFTNFKRGGQILYVTRIPGVANATLLVDNVNDVDSIKPSEDGKILLRGSWHEESFKTNNVREDRRYSHILLSLPPLPSASR